MLTQNETEMLLINSLSKSFQQYSPSIWYLFTSGDSLNWNKEKVDRC